jgi:hypothetical protein
MIRKILSREEQEKRDHKKKVIMSIVLAVIMLLSTAGYFVMDFSSAKKQTLDFNGIQFKQTDYATWAFDYGGKSYDVLFTPDSVTNISVSITKKINDYSNSVLYISGEPTEAISTSASQEIAKNLVSFISRVNYACLDSSCNQDYPIKNCSADNILIFKNSLTNSSTITQNEKCIILSYTPFEEEKTADALLYGLLGIKL